MLYFGVNVVTGWQKAEYSQMGLWPGDEHFAHRYAYCAEYVQVMRELWSTGRSDLKGEFFQMDDCRLLPMPSAPVEIISAGQSDAGNAVVGFCRICAYPAAARLQDDVRVVSSRSQAHSVVKQMMSERRDHVLFVDAIQIAGFEKHLLSVQS